MKQSIICSLFVLLFVWTPTGAQAGTKEELVRLQNDVIGLQNQFREFEKIIKEDNSGLKSLMEQLNDQVAKSNILLDKVVVALEQQASEDMSGNEDVIPEIRTLSGKIDEMVTSIAALARQVSELNVQSKPLNRFVPSDSTTSDETFNQALNDLIGGDPEVAIQGFNAYLNFYPSGNKAIAARYYIGEAYYNMDRYPEAIESFTRIIEENADSDKVASALYKRGKSAIEIGDSERAVADFNKVIELFPDSPEASLSKAELQTLGALNTAQPRRR